ncbi:DUF721 domain-containing protein [Methylocella tundrae]|uniref:DUF721 domain-containing protein n=1 Tax=Methylocella tundrae TaxID=227605 RepID=A0A4U8Z4M3_METTU|nr:DciA family protein [Methylocella tundrae]WPP04156.1 DciA family protein [Methylocella tundrae]VFU10426.1 conserved protein of unknown function [Methylocella tundrae]
MRAFRPKDPWSRPLADLVGPIIDPTLARRGFGQSDVILFWDEIVGERLAAMSQPIKLQWPPRPRGTAGGSSPASLIVRVETGFALELQHRAGAVIERVNAHLGWRCVDRLLLKQGPLERRAPARPPRTPPALAIVKAAEAAVGNIPDEALRKALTRLGACVLTRSSLSGRD